MTIDTIKLQDALKLLEYPKELGKYKRKKVMLKTGKYGLFITWGTFSRNVNEIITLEDAIEIIEKNRALVEFKSDKKIYFIFSGPHGNYISVQNKSGKGKTINYKLSENILIKDITLEKIEKIISNKKVYKKY